MLAEPFPRFKKSWDLFRFVKSIDGAFMSCDVDALFFLFRRFFTEAVDFFFDDVV